MSWQLWLGCAVGARRGSILVLGLPDIYVEHGGFTPPGAGDVATVHNEPLPVRKPDCARHVAAGRAFIIEIHFGVLVKIAPLLRNSEPIERAL